MLRSRLRCLFYPWIRYGFFRIWGQRMLTRNYQTKFLNGKTENNGTFVLTVFIVLLVFFKAENAQACWNIRRQFVWVCFVFLNLPSHASFNKLGHEWTKHRPHFHFHALDFSKFSIGQQSPNPNTHHDEGTSSRNGVEEIMSPVILILSKQFFLTIIRSITDLNFLNLLNY